MHQLLAFYFMVKRVNAYHAVAVNFLSFMPKNRHLAGSIAIACKPTQTKPDSIIMFDVNVGLLRLGKHVNPTLGSNKKIGLSCSNI